MRSAALTSQFEPGRPCAWLGASALLAAALGCGGATNNGTGVQLPAEGDPIGNLTCAVIASEEGSALPQGASLHLTFTLEDANLGIPAADLPVLFEASGGRVAVAPARTDELGQAEVTFVAGTDVGDLGPGFVRMSTPGRQLRCDASFTVVRPACTLDASVRTESGDPLRAFDACGGPAIPVRVGLDEPVVTLRLRRPDFATGGLAAEADRPLEVALDGFSPESLVVRTGPDGTAEVALDLASSRGGEVALVARPVLEPEDGPLELGCGQCALTFLVEAPDCDQHLASVNVTYPDGGPPLRPTQDALVSVVVTLDGEPVPDVAFVIDADHGTIDGSAFPVTKYTASEGSASPGALVATYRPDAGFVAELPGPLELIDFRTVDRSLTCAFGATVEVSTCALAVATAVTPVPAGEPTAVRLVVTGAPAETLDGQRVAVSVTGGFLVPPGSGLSELVADVGTAHVDLTFSSDPTFQGTAVATLSFLDGYPCAALSASFEVAAP